MAWEGIAAKVGIDAAKGGFETIRKSVSKKKYKEYITAAVAELLALDPDIDLAEAKLLAAHATGVPPSVEFLRARTMLEKTKTYAKAKAPRKAARRGHAKRSVKRAAAKKGPKR
jgi:hypothetical protein